MSSVALRLLRESLGFVFSMEEEFWKDVVGYEGLYQVSNFGRVLSLNYDGTRKSKVLKGSVRKGYPYVELYHNGISKKHCIHRLVAIAFIPIPDELKIYLGTRLLQVNHKDENKKNNKVGNLEWCNASYNLSYGTRPRRVLDSHRRSGSSKAEKPLRQYDLSGIFIMEYPSAHEAARRNGYSFGPIAKCARGEKKQYRGFLWRYIDKSKRVERDYCD